MPVRQGGQVLVQVMATAVNHLDIWEQLGRRGRHKIQMTLPRIPGHDIAGVVREVGDRTVEFPRVGDRVVLYPARGCGNCMQCLSGDDNFCPNYGSGRSNGGYAEWVTVPVRELLPVPAHLDFVEAAAVPLTFMTAWQMLVHRAKLQPGETVLVHAIGSGVGAACLRIAKAIGAYVIGTTGSAGKKRRALEEGADAVVDYSAASIRRVVRKITSDRGVDVIADSVGGRVFLISTSVLSIGGRLTSCGATDDARVQLDLHKLQERRGTYFFTVMGSSSDLFEAMRMLRERQIKPIVDCVLPLARAADAHRLLNRRGVFGKVVLVPQDEWRDRWRGRMGIEPTQDASTAPRERF